MKRLGKIAVCLAGGLAFNASLRADDLSATNSPLVNNPYAAIVVKNIFGLVPPAPPPDPNIALTKDLPKITPTGIMSTFGLTKALFKVTGGAGGKPGQPAKDEFYALRQGQMQDDIEVTKIDEKGGLVTFDNHGITQELPLASAPSGGGSGAAATGGMGNSGMTSGAAPGGGGGPGGFTRFGAGNGGLNNGGAGGGNPGNNGTGPGANNGMNFGANTQGRTYQPPASTMTPEETTANLTKNYLDALHSGSPTANIFPLSQSDKEAINNLDQ